MTPRTITLAVIGDAYVAQPNVGNGGSNVLAVGLYGGDVYRSLLKVAQPDWSGLKVKQVVSAKLRIRNSGQSVVTRGATPRVIARRTLETWTSGGVNWSNRPSTTTTGETTSGVLATADGAWVELDLTAIVRAWAPTSVQGGGGKPPYGVTLLSFDDAATSRTTEFYSRQSAYDPRVILVYEDNLRPNVPVDLVPGVQDNGDAAVAFYVTGSARNDPGITYAVSKRYARFGATRSDPDAGDYISGLEVQLYADSATDATPGAALADVVRTYTGSPVSVTHDLDITALTTGTAYRARMRTRDRGNLWSDWTSLASCRFRPDTKPALTNPSADVDSARPTFYGSLSDPDAGASISAAWVNVIRDDPLGSVVLWSSGWVDIGGGTRFSVVYAGSQDLSFGVRYRYELALRDDVGGASDFVTGLTLTPKQVTGPDAMSPVDVGTKRDTITPTLTVAHSVAFDAYECEVAAYADGTGTLWDVPVTTMASGTTVGLVYAGTVLVWGRTYYWRAKVRIGGTSWSEWSPWYGFYINALPSRPVVTIDTAVASGAGAYGAYVTVADTTPDIRAPYVDLDRLRGYMDNPTREEIQIVTAADGLDITGSPFVRTVGITDTYTPAALTLETTYRVRVRYDDGAAQRSEWSAWTTFKVSGPPAVTAGTAVDIADPTARLDWTFAGSSGKAQAGYHVAVYANVTGELVYDSGYVASAATEAIVPGYILATATAYRWGLTVFDADMLAAAITTVETWTTAFAIPDELTGVLTATPDAGSAAMALAWTASTIAVGLFWRYLVYRRDPDTGLYGRIGEVTDRDTPAYLDQEAPHGIAADYAVTVSNGWAECDPPLKGSGTLPLRWWIVTPSDTGLTFELRYVEGHHDSVDPQQEAFVPLGRSYPVVVSGGQLGPTGTVTVRLLPADASLLGLIRRAAAVDPYVLLKSALGDVLRVKIGTVGRERGTAGVQVVTFDYRTVA